MTQRGKRFFVTGNATRPYRVKVPSSKEGEPDRLVPIEFTPMFPDGGNWVGCFETEDHVLADLVVKLGPPIHEVNAASIEEVKKSLELTKNRLDPRRTSTASRPVDVNTALDLSQSNPNAKKPDLASAQESFRFSDLVGETSGADIAEGDLVEKSVGEAAEVAKAEAAVETQTSTESTKPASVEKGGSVLKGDGPKKG